MAKSGTITITALHKKEKKPRNNTNFGFNS